ncbi:MAG: hypothetical protein KTR16_11620 [Acidiferrobacterales bacterium]|nr:hypothetical protein [Acidiferrobacterales bacterium]
MIYKHLSAIFSKVVRLPISWQILFFVVASNAVHVVLMMTGLRIESEQFIFLALSVSFWFCVFILVAPDNIVTTGHKLLTLTCAIGALYCSTATVAATWADRSLFAWHVYSPLHDHFYTIMQTLTAIEILSVFANTAVRLGRIGGAIDGLINHVYSSTIGRAYNIFSHKGL